MFRLATERAPHPVPQAYRKGKEALSTTPHDHQNLVACNRPWTITGSINLDAALEDTKAHKNSSRWDYGLGIRHERSGEIAIWAEVHTASDNQVVPMLLKLSWLKNWLRTEAKDLNGMTRPLKGVGNFYWIATPTGIYIRRGSKMARRIEQEGLPFPQPRLEI